MKKSIIIFVLAAVLAGGFVAYGWIFVDDRIGAATLTEKTITGDEDAANGLMVGFRADSADNLHWFNGYDYTDNKSASFFKMGEMSKEKELLVYDDFRFTGWETTPCYTQLQYDGLAGLQDKKIQSYYNKIQQNVLKTGKQETGKIRLKDYLDYYPISFRFQFGTKLYSSDNLLTDLKVYDEAGKLNSKNAEVYDSDIELYVALNNMFKIPVIKNEYQEYKISEVKKFDPMKSLGYKTVVKRTTSEQKDYYEFDPIIVLQEENLRDGKTWVHPDLAKASNTADEFGGTTDTTSDAAGADAKASTADATVTDAAAVDADDTEGKSASEYNLKNRMLFVVNNRTAKGAPIDVSMISQGYGIYELPFEVLATRTVINSKRDEWIENPKPKTGELKMVYPLDAKAEYVEMSQSEDHRYLAVFSVKKGSYYVEMVDADTWTSKGPVKLFPESKNMTYNWGEDGSLAVTNHEGYIAILAKTTKTKKLAMADSTTDENGSYEVLFSGKVGGNLDEALFDSKMINKKHSYSAYKYSVDRGLAITVKDGKAALVQNLLVGDPKDNIRNAALECAVIDKSGVIYRGVLRSDIVDIKYDMNKNEIKAVRDLLHGKVDAKADADVVKQLIRPVRNENRAEWK